MKEVKDLDNEKYKTMIEDLIRWKAIPCSYISRINMKMAIPDSK
jgi:hypothetical protein